VELARVRLHDVDGDDLGVVELPDGSVLEVGDEVAAEDGRIVRVTRLVPSLPRSVIAALAEVRRVPKVRDPTELPRRSR
jgi:hypothetical protein